MYYDERIINGEWHYRTTPDGEWRKGRWDEATLSPPALEGMLASDGSLTYAGQRKVVEHITTELGAAIGILQSTLQRAEAIDCHPLASPVAAQAVADDAVKRAWAAYNERQDELDAAEDRPLLDRMDECMRAALESLAHPNAAPCDAQGASRG